MKIYPSGKIYEFLPVDKVPSDFLKDLGLIYTGKGINPYTPEKYEILIVGGGGFHSFRFTNCR